MTEQIASTSDLKVAPPQAVKDAAAERLEQ
jgi:hypothetical protein